MLIYKSVSILHHISKEDNNEFFNLKINVEHLSAFKKNIQEMTAAEL
jgi:hypothetical protein